MQCVTVCCRVPIHLRKFFGDLLHAATHTHEYMWHTSFKSDVTHLCVTRLIDDSHAMIGAQHLCRYAPCHRTPGIFCGKMSYTDEADHGPSPPYSHCNTLQY
mmetsp:Transcript_2439/g.3444  ORF Transcript_2439/g.3444 Transcript_2439/m.3444 type:complete len:102 (+) Transcript_2439:236-541(+)